MIKRILFAFIAVLFIMSCNEDSDNTNNQSDTTEITSTELPVVSLAEFDSLAANYVGKEIKISGIIDHICKHGGKKLLLVDGDKDIHVLGDERFDESLSGSKATVIGIVEEERIDSAYLAEKLKHDQGSYGGGSEADKEKLARITEYINMMQDSLKKSGVDHFSNYSLKFISLEEEK